MTGRGCNRPGCAPGFLLTRDGIFNALGVVPAAVGVTSTPSEIHKQDVTLQHNSSSMFGAFIGRDMLYFHHSTVCPILTTSSMRKLFPGKFQGTQCHDDDDSCSDLNGKVLC
ncbi:hypothetical protein CBL_07746 [Carabus blaptoides fortunei]